MRITHQHPRIFMPCNGGHFNFQIVVFLVFECLLLGRLMWIKGWGSCCTHTPTHLIDSLRM